MRTAEEIGLHASETVGGELRVRDLLLGDSVDMLEAMDTNDDSRLQLTEVSNVLGFAKVNFGSCNSDGMQ